MFSSFTSGSHGMGRGEVLANVNNFSVSWGEEDSGEFLGGMKNVMKL